MKKQNELVLTPPDGGWGWMACLGYSLITFSLRSLDPSFGLLFGDLLKDLKIETTGASVILSALESVSSFSGLFVGPLMKRFSCQKIAIFGSLLSCTGLILTSRANSLAYIICTYGILGGLGTGFATTAGFVSLNSYFKKKRNQVVGLSMTGTTLGMMAMPHIVRLLLVQYDFRGAVLIIGGISLHAIVGSCLLEPVSKHLKRPPDEKTSESVSNDKVEERDALLKMEEIDEDEEPKVVGEKIDDETRIRWKIEKTSELTNEIRGDEGKPKDSFTTRLVSFFDLKLLMDPAYLNIILGISLVYEAEINYKLIMPFFLGSIGMTKTEIAFALSLTAFADIVARLTVPTIGTKLKLTNRKMFWISTTLLALNRSLTVQLMPGNFLMAVLLLNGFLRGIAMLNLNLTISEHCTLDVLPSALGIMSVFRGLVIVVLGPFIGYIRDATGSYRACMFTMSSFIIFYSIMWGIEFLVRNIRMKKIKIDEASNCEIA